MIPKENTGGIDAGSGATGQSLSVMRHGRAFLCSPRPGEDNHGTGRMMTHKSSQAEKQARVLARRGRHFCPVTGGQPTRMTEASFKRMCQLRRSQKNGWRWGDDCVGGCLRQRVCRQAPPEVEFIQI
ncbi:MAG: hypothetical protein LBU39_08460 [Desulfobulbaceae bacterium]|jgi:hypothetical protein|nr:hypothetical protein [Desulfobulbaceae bacterium]